MIEVSGVGAGRGAEVVDKVRRELADGGGGALVAEGGEGGGGGRGVGDVEAAEDVCL